MRSGPSDWEDGLRIDSAKEDIRKSPDGTHDLYYCNDVFWQQAYAIRAEGYEIESNSSEREIVLTYRPKGDSSLVIEPGESYTFGREIIVARNLVAIHTLDRSGRSSGEQELELTIVDAQNTVVPDARIELRRDGQLIGIVQTNSKGKVTAKLLPGEYTVWGSVAGKDILPRSTSITVESTNRKQRLIAENYSPGRVSARITDGAGQPIPAKVDFTGHDRTPTPDWGPESAEHFVRNLAYTEDGTFDIPLQSGEYNVIISHGPEYDALFTRLIVEPGMTAELNASLQRSVQTTGWISSDFHSHSSPSGDNTASQLGRVLNLAAENIEFAPCTEHNRISTYAEHISSLSLESFLATVSGIELTGRPLPLNHQNVFPLIHTPRTQDGGGPLTDEDPEIQIERVTLWDNRSQKLVQQNHPDLGWLFYDKNGDGSPDEGYWRSFRLIDVMEIHPIDRILRLAPFDFRDGVPNANQRMFNWLQLLNQGHRIFGVVNTDAHYNFHGSGWLRNWIRSSTDEPRQIDPLEMVRSAEQGQLIMSNGPFLEATFWQPEDATRYISGQNLVTPDGRVKVHVRVQCPNWLDVDTVFLLINGRKSDEFEFTRKDHPELFDNGVLKFDIQIEFKLEYDSHIIVVTGHRTEKLGPVMGPYGGAQHPAALTNPVFIDVGGDGFEPNKDTLDHPLPVKFGTSNNR